MKHSFAKTELINDNFFPYLDMELFWQRSALQTRVFFKPGKSLKYLNTSSTHQATVFTAIPWGVMMKLSNLKTKNDANENLRLDQIYPDHASALEVSGLAPKNYLTKFKDG